MDTARDKAFNTIVTNGEVGKALIVRNLTIVEADRIKYYFGGELQLNSREQIWTWRCKNSSMMDAVKKAQDET